MTNKDTADSATGQKRLRRLETFLDVVYAVLFVNFIYYLPQEAEEDLAWLDLPFELFSLLLDRSVELMRLLIGVGLLLLSWNLTHKLLGPLERTNVMHTVLTQLQLIFVCLFLFFAVADPTLQSVSSPVGQSICLALSGFIGMAGWWYARQNGLVKAEVTNAQKDDVGKSIIIEPVTALLNTGLGFLGPGIWTLGWFVIPLVLVTLFKKGRFGAKLRR